ncbi:acyltransferase, partial [Amaricoccus sp. HAR-UPW-R2A-40]
MVRLGELARGRDNNLNLIRMVAATAVLVSHAWPLTLGPSAIEPLNDSVGHSLGRISVYIFFVISGFLITASFERSETLFRFVAARVMRLMPGLIVSLVFVALVLGLAVTRLPATEYLTSPDTWTFLLSNTLLVSPQYTLPGVFVNNPVPTVEGSIWTLFYEAACYGLVFLLGIGAMLRPRRLGIFVCVYAVVCTAVLATGVEMPYKLYRLLLLSLPFVVGMGAWAWRDRLPLSGAAAIGLWVVAILLDDTFLAYISFILAVAYATFWLAYVPGGWIRNYNRLGDYSYGMYIYAIPLQGLVVMLFGA